jgi:hypothetical protein
MFLMLYNLSRLYKAQEVGNEGYRMERKLLQGLQKVSIRCNSGLGSGFKSVAARVDTIEFQTILTWKEDSECMGVKAT